MDSITAKGSSLVSALTRS